MDREIPFYSFVTSYVMDLYRASVQRIAKTTQAMGKETGRR